MSKLNCKGCIFFKSYKPDSNVGVCEYLNLSVTERPYVCKVNKFKTK